MRSAIFFSLFFLFASFASSVAQDRQNVQQQRFMFWNVENAFWPSDDSLHQDDEFTPEGIRHWTRSRLRQKLLQLSRVILAAGDGKAPMIVGLAEIEGDSVMHYWTHSTPLWDLHYNYIVSNGPDVRGIQTALLYQPTDFKLLHADFHRVLLPDGVRPTRDVLHAAGRIVNGDTLDVIVCHLPSRLGGSKQSQSARDAAHHTVMHVADSIRHCRLHPAIVIMGDMNDYARKSRAWWGKDYVNLMAPLQKSLKTHPSAYGSHKYQGEWGFLDQFIIYSPSNPSNLSNFSLPSDATSGSNPSNPSNLSNSSLPSDATSGSNLSNPSNPSFSISNARVFYLPFMLAEDISHLGHRPARSYYGYQYEGGYSDHLPILLDFDVYF